MSFKLFVSFLSVIFYLQQSESDNFLESNAMISPKAVMRNINSGPTRILDAPGFILSISLLIILLLTLSFL